MGQPQSVPTAFTVQPWMTDDYVPFGAQRDSTNSEYVVKPITSCTTVHNKKIIKTGSQAIWSLVKPIGDSPCSRISHFSAYDPSTNRLYIGYGIDKDGTPLNDVWAFDFGLQKWARLQIHGQEISPRAGARAIILSHYIAIFGGYCNNQYFADFHIIDLNTYECSRPIFGGGGPTRRTMPMMSTYNDKIYVWGGYSKESQKWPNELNILDLKEKQWTVANTDVVGRTGFSYVVDGSTVYIHGGSKTDKDGMIIFDMEHETIANTKVFGVSMRTRIMNSSLVDAGPILILIGGRSPDDEYSFAYMFHKERKYWSLFSVVPDGETVTTEDGDVVDSGFRLPRNVSISLVYQNNERAVYGFLGAPHSDPPYIFVLSIGEYLSYINMQDDMLQILHS